MKNEEKIVELMTEIVYKQDVMIDEFKVLNSEVKNIQKELQKTNLIFKETRTIVMRLADEIVIVHNHEKRIRIVEKTVLKK